MVNQKVYRSNTGVVATGASYTGTWTADATYTLKRVHVIPRGNTVITNVQFYADLAGVPFFTPDVPADLLDPVNPVQPLLDLAFPKGSTVNYKLTNNSGASENYDVVLILETAAWPPA